MKWEAFKKLMEFAGVQDDTTIILLNLHVADGSVIISGCDKYGVCDFRATLPCRNGKDKK